MVHRNLPARRTDIFRPHLQIEPKTTAHCTTQGFECPPNLYAMQLLKQSPLERDVNQTDEPSRWWAAHITTIYAYAHAAYLGPPPYLSGPTPGNTSRSHKIHTWHCTRGRMNASKICLLWPHLKFSRPGIRRAEALRIFICPSGAPGVPFTHVP